MPQALKIRALRLIRVARKSTNPSAVISNYPNNNQYDQIVIDYAAHHVLHSPHSTLSKQLENVSVKHDYALNDHSRMYADINARTHTMSKHLKERAETHPSEYIPPKFQKPAYARPERYKVTEGKVIHNLSDRGDPRQPYPAWHVQGGTPRIGETYAIVDGKTKAGVNGY